MLEPLAELLIADSRFLGMCSPIANEDEALRFQGKCQKNHPEASHVALVWRTYNNTGWDEDGEPPNAVGPQVVEEVSAGYALVLVRYFHGQQLLGVTCGRLSQCYRSVARDTMHRYLHPNQPYERDCGKPTSNMYGLGAGDCELILNVIPEEEERDEENGMKLVERIRAELNFDGFRGAQGETLPRLQNLQADLSENAIPIYRYPGNYSGQEWKTFQWSPTSLMIKEKVEGALQPIFAQTMNHCVTNYYRDGHDFISHHSDKDLDLNPEAVIVSVSLGDERVLELKRRSEPRDVTRLVLPHRSMLVLGPITNRLFSHSILPKEDSTEARISLTFRDVRTFWDLHSGRLFGQGVKDFDSLQQVRSRFLWENVAWMGSWCTLAGWLVYRKPMAKIEKAIVAGMFLLGTSAARYFHRRWIQRTEERAARAFFSKASVTGTKY